jgi:hypothetical protein
MGRRVPDETSMEEKYRILEEDWLIRNMQQADLFRDKLKEFYPKSNDIRYAEFFELSEYGRQPKAGELSELLIASGKSD